MTNVKYEKDIWTSPGSASFFEQVRDLVALKYGCAPNLNREFYVTEDDDKVYINMAVVRPDSMTGIVGRGDIWRKQLWPSMTETQIAHMMIGMSIDYSEHECREGFLWNGRRVFGPHIDIAAQWAVSEEYEQRELGENEFGWIRWADDIRSS